MEVGQICQSINRACSINRPTEVENESYVLMMIHIDDLLFAKLKTLLK